MENGNDFTDICLNGPKTPKNIRQTDFLHVSEHLEQLLTKFGKLKFLKIF